MLDIVSLVPGADSRLRFLLENVFGRVVLVKEYAQAMDIAKQNNFTCITSDF